MKTIRKGNDIVVRWRIFRYGQEYDIASIRESISLILSNMGEKKEITDYSIVDVNTIVFKYLAKDQGLGIYRLLLIDKSRNSTRIIEECNAFRLVNTSDAANNDDTLESAITITLTSELTAPADGLSAYEVALQNGFIGTEEEWLQSLKGEQGPQGIQGDKGDKGDRGEQGEKGLSAYQVAIANGFVGTEEEWLQSLVPDTTDIELAEAQRQAKELERIEAENARQSAELERQNASTEAVSSANEAATTAQQKAAEANTAVSSANAAANAANAAASNANNVVDEFNSIIVQGTGSAQDKVMSQKAVTDAMTASQAKLSELVGKTGELSLKIGDANGIKADLSKVTNNGYINTSYVPTVGSGWAYGAIPVIKGAKQIVFKNVPSAAYSNAVMNYWRDADGNRIGTGFGGNTFMGAGVVSIDIPTNAVDLMTTRDTTTPTTAYDVVFTSGGMEESIFNLGESIALLKSKVDDFNMEVITKDLLKDGFTTHLFDEPIEAGTKIVSVKLQNQSYLLSSCFFIKEDGGTDININTITSFPYTTTKKYIGYAANEAGYLMLTLDKGVSSLMARRQINVKADDTIYDVVKKLWIASLVKNVDVFFEKSTYLIDDEAINYIAGFFAYNKSTCGLPLGAGCRYYLNGSTIIVEQTTRYGNGVEVSCFDNQRAGRGFEIYDGILINNNSKYCIHDETAGTANKYTNIIKNVRMYAKNNAQCAYGCGTGLNTEVIFENCYLYNDGTAKSSSNMVFHAPTNNTSGNKITFSLAFVGCYFDNGTTLSVGTANFDTSRDDLRLVVANSHQPNGIPSYVLELFNDKCIYGND